MFRQAIQGCKCPGEIIQKSSDTTITSSVFIDNSNCHSAHTHTHTHRRKQSQALSQFSLTMDMKNTIIPSLLQLKLTQLSVHTSICQWITSFLTDRQQLVRLGKFSSSTRTISTGAPQGCVLSHCSLSLYTKDCTSIDPSVKLLKFADDTTVIGLIQDGDESTYRLEVKELAVWCSLNNLELNTLKTV